MDDGCLLTQPKQKGTRWFSRSAFFYFRGQFLHNVPAGTLFYSLLNKIVARINKISNDSEESLTGRISAMNEDEIDSEEEKTNLKDYAINLSKQAKKTKFFKPRHVNS